MVDDLFEIMLLALLSGYLMFLQRCSKNIFSIRKITTNDQNKILIKSGIPKIEGSTDCTHVYSQSFGGVSWPRFKLRYDPT